MPASRAMSQYCQSRVSGFSNLVMPTPTTYAFVFVAGLALVLAFVLAFAFVLMARSPTVHGPRSGRAGD
ncbi:hypothetical protein GCM10010372_69960 [Streptomyces tauricus]|nr:hypothetical protein GCM10010372_69960 [Streptomyces tauricus]